MPAPVNATQRAPVDNHWATSRMASSSVAEPIGTLLGGSTCKWYGIAMSSDRTHIATWKSLPFCEYFEHAQVHRATNHHNCCRQQAESDRRVCGTCQFGRP